MRWYYILLVIVLWSAGPASAQGWSALEGRLIHLEEGQKALMQRIEDGDKNLGQWYRRK